jgi:hypothetical protein
MGALLRIIALFTGLQGVLFLMVVPAMGHREMNPSTEWWPLVGGVILFAIIGLLIVWAAWGLLLLRRSGHVGVIGFYCLEVVALFIGIRTAPPDERLLLSVWMLVLGGIFVTLLLPAARRATRLPA